MSQKLILGKLILTFSFISAFFLAVNYSNASIVNMQEIWTSSGDDQATANYGRSVAIAGDVNNDGYNDIIVGAEAYDTSNGNAGKAYLYLGSASGISTTPAWTSSGDDQAQAYFGNPVAGAGDVNGDGYGDVIAAAYTFNTANADAGKAYLYLGGASGLSTTPAWTSSGDDQASAFFGYSIASAGDVNNDGYGDILVGAVGYDTANLNAGKVYLYLGGASGLSAIPAWTSSGDDQAGAFYGVSISSINVNNDGYSDAIIGANGYDTTKFDAGKAYLYLGSAAGLSIASSWTSSGEDKAVSSFGRSVTDVGDVNHDGYRDVIIGADLYDTASHSDAGKAYLYLGGAGGFGANASWSSSGDDQQSARYGGVVNSAGDVNGDGYDDVVIGASQYDSAGWDNGKSYLYLGSINGLITSSSWAAVEDKNNNARYGAALAGGIDVNADGYGDFIIGAFGYSTSNSTAGKVYIYTNAADFSILINSGAEYTVNRKTALTLSASASDAPTEMIISKNADFSGSVWETFNTSKTFTLSKKSGVKNVYAKFRDLNGAESKTVSDAIKYLPKPRFVTKSAKTREILIEKAKQKYFAKDFDFIFKLYPKKLQKKKYYLEIQKVKKYPSQYFKENKASLKKYWKVKSNLKKYKAKKADDKFKIKVIFKYTNKELKASKMKEKDLVLKYHHPQAKPWVDMIAKHDKKANTFTVFLSDSPFSTIYFAIAK